MEPIPVSPQALAWPEGRVDYVLDTDTYNEIDDQFALVYSLLAEEKINCLAVHAAPFHNSRSEGPADGMEKSFEEILRVLDSMDRPSEGLAFRGCTEWLSDKETPVDSPAVDNLIKLATQPRDGRLYVATIGAPTNVASAIIKDPSIREKIVVLWLGGHALNWPKTNEFNMRQDLKASQIIMDCGVPLVRFPCLGVVDQLRTTLAELERFLKGRGRIGDYLFEICEDYNEQMKKPGGSKVIWDLAPVAWLVNPDWFRMGLISSPILTDNETWSFDPGRHLINECFQIKRDGVFGDIFKRAEALTRE
ncbi:MAG: nucleoside hydrolase [Opitutales bacterium]